LGNGQNRATLLGKILRIDVNSPSAVRNYGLPADNPFVGNTVGYKEEIFAYGFRNPWRFSFDSATGRLWVGDVGQNRMEEIDVVEKGGNYGWNTMEGSLTYSPGSQVGLDLPFYEYDHTLGIAIVGGYVYHGSELPELAGNYVYGDYGSGKIWALAANGTNVLLADSNLSISAFGLDQNEELYICAFDGRIHKFSATTIPEFPNILSLAFLAITTLTVAAVFGKRTVFSKNFCQPRAPTQLNKKIHSPVNIILM
jgi:hypothetical protein